MTSAAHISHFIMVDDSTVDLFVVGKLIKLCYPGSDVQSFAFPDIALSYFASHRPEHLTVVLLDINMPILDGFQFLEEFDKLPEDVKKFYRVFILTSSQNANDISRGKTNKNVADVLLKPLTKDTLLNLLKIIS